MRSPKFYFRKLTHSRTALGDFEGGFAHDGADVYARAHESRDTVEHLQVDDHWPGAHQPLLNSVLALAPSAMTHALAGVQQDGQDTRALIVRVRHFSRDDDAGGVPVSDQPRALLSSGLQHNGSSRLEGPVPAKFESPARHGRARLALDRCARSATAGCAPLERDSMHVNCHYTTFT